MNNVQRANQETANTSNLTEKFEVRISKSQLSKKINALINSLDVETFAVIVSTFFRLYENKCETITLQKEDNIASLKEYICNVGIPTFEDAVLKTGNAEDIYKFASNIKGANISELEDAIIKTGDAVEIYVFARNIKGANISKLEDAIIKTENAGAIYDFACNIEGANISKLEDAIIKTGNARFIYRFANNIEGANISKLEDAIIKTGDAEFIYHFAKEIEGANISKIENYSIELAVENRLIEDIIFLDRTLNSSRLQQITDEIKFYNLFN